MSDYHKNYANQADIYIAELKARIEELEAKQEPVAWANYESRIILDADEKKSLGVAAERWNIPLYTAPPAPEVPEGLLSCIEVQCRKGNWNYDPYMHGMANGMIFAKACIEDTTPQYLSAPDKWIADTAAPAVEDNRDAERYRWLVENAVIETDRWKHDGKDPSATKHPLDKAIDTAMDIRKEETPVPTIENGKENPDDEYFGREAYYEQQRKDRGWE